MKYIFINDCHWNNSEEAEDVMLFPYGDKFEKLTPEIVSDILNALGWKFDECYWVKAKDAQYYCYSACWFRPREEEAWIEDAKKAKAKKAATNK